jgi:hypothetical protein
MRMAGPDVILFVVGALLFGGATYAIVQQGGPGAFGQAGSAAGFFNVAYTTASESLEPISIPNVRSSEVPFTLNQTDVSKVTITVACTDGAAGTAAPFAVTVALTAPNNISADPIAGRCGQPLEFSVDVAPVPPAGTVIGATEPEARANLFPDANATRAQGEWKVSVTGGRGGPGGVAVPGVVIPEPTGTITVKLDRWSASLTPGGR